MSPNNAQDVSARSRVPAIGIGGHRPLGRPPACVRCLQWLGAARPHAAAVHRRSRCLRRRT